LGGKPNPKRFSLLADIGDGNNFAPQDTAVSGHGVEALRHLPGSRPQCGVGAAGQASTDPDGRVTAEGLEHATGRGGQGSLSLAQGDVATLTRREFLMLSSLRVVIAAGGAGIAQPPELPQLIDGLQGWISTTKGRFLFGDGTTTPSHGKAVHAARNVQDQTVLFSQTTAGLRPTWDAATFDVPCIRSNGAQYLTRSTSLAAPGLVIVGCAVATGSTGFRCLAAARSTQTPGGDPAEEAWHLNKSNTGQMRAVVATDTEVDFADTPAILGEKLLVMMEVVGNRLQVWQVGSTGEQTVVGTRIVADGEQALLAKYYNNAITSVLEGAIFEFAQYAPAPSRAERRLLVQYFQGLIWPAVFPPLAAAVDAGQIQQGANESVDVVAPSSGASLVLASIDEQPAIGSISASGNNVVINIPSGAALGSYSGQYCLRSNVAGSRLVDFGRVDFSVVGGGAGAALPEDEPLPAVASATLNATTANFDSVYASAQPGNHIVLANGNYGAKILNRDFPITNRLVIRAANLHGAIFSGTVTDGDTQAGSGPATLIISGDGHILSGLNVDNGSTFVYNVIQIKNAAAVRVTRCRIRTGQVLSHLMRNTADILFDHNHFDNYSLRCVEWEDSTGLTTSPPPSNILRPIYARNWFTNGVGTGLLSCLATGNNHVPRQFYNGIIRFNYLGPTLQAGDWVHNKGSGTIFAFNRAEGGGNSTLTNRLGLNCKFYGNYAPDNSFILTDGYCDAFGNFSRTANGEGLRCRAGNSRRFDDTRTAITWNGGTPGQETSIFYYLRRSRIAGNSGAITVGFQIDQMCSHDPQPCGRNNDGSFGFIADSASDPRNGIHIYDNSHAPTFVGAACGGLTPYTQITNNWQQQAPVSWAAELPTWVTNVVDVTKRSLSPWSIAQALTRGDAANPNTGPFRDSPGGLP
jgi:hypothetical protein